MEESFITYLSKYISLSQKEIELLQNYYTIKTLNKNELLFCEGKIANEIYFLKKGTIRLFYTCEGYEKTAFFYSQNQFICAGESYTFQIPATENFQALEKSEVIIFTRNNIDLLLTDLPNLEFIARIAVESELISYQHMVKSFITKSAEQRYLDLLTKHGDLFQKVPQQYIASFLGVSPETLSRIKKRVFN